MLKATPPNNKDLRFWGYGARAGFEYSLLKDFVSLGGLRKGGTGFSPDGIKIEGGTIVAEAIADIDMISKLSFLPLKIIINYGFRLPVDEKYRHLSQYTLEAGMAYSVGAHCIGSARHLSEPSTRPTLISSWPEWQPAPMVPGGAPYTGKNFPVAAIIEIYAVALKRRAF